MGALVGAACGGTDEVTFPSPDVNTNETGALDAREEARLVLRAGSDVSEGGGAFERWVESGCPIHRASATVLTAERGMRPMRRTSRSGCLRREPLHRCDLFGAWRLRVGRQCRELCLRSGLCAQWLDLQ